MPTRYHTYNTQGQNNREKRERSTVYLFIYGIYPYKSFTYSKVLFIIIKVSERRTRDVRGVLRKAVPPCRWRARPLRVAVSVPALGGAREPRADRAEEAKKGEGERVVASLRRWGGLRREISSEAGRTRHDRSRAGVEEAREPVLSHRLNTVDGSLLWEWPSRV